MGLGCIQMVMRMFTIQDCTIKLPRYFVGVKVHALVVIGGVGKLYLCSGVACCLCSPAFVMIVCSSRGVILVVGIVTAWVTGPGVV